MRRSPYDVIIGAIVHTAFIAACTILVLIAIILIMTIIKTTGTM